MPRNGGINVKELCEVLRDLVGDLVEAWHRFQPLDDLYEDLFGILEEVKIPEKKLYIPVKKIAPKKVVLLSKRLNVHYCRNNC
jgi:hypothetical protein